MQTDIQLAQKAAARIIKVDNMELHPVDKYTLDVFVGEGHDNYHRFRFYKNRWFRINGSDGQRSIDTSKFPNVGTFQ